MAVRKWRWLAQAPLLNLGCDAWEFSLPNPLCACVLMLGGCVVDEPTCLPKHAAAQRMHPTLCHFMPSSVRRCRRQQSMGAALAQALPVAYHLAEQPLDHPDNMPGLQVIAAYAPRAALAPELLGAFERCCMRHCQVSCCAPGRLLGSLARVLGSEKAS